MINLQTKLERDPANMTSSDEKVLRCTNRHLWYLSGGLMSGSLSRVEWNVLVFLGFLGFLGFGGGREGNVWGG